MEEKPVKKSIRSILAILLALCTVAVFAACNGNSKIDPTEPLVTTDITDEPDTEPVVVDPVTDPTEDDTITEEPEIETEAPTEATTEAPSGATTVTTTKVTTTAKPAADPTKMNKDELIKYYNERMNYVRDKKPAFTRVTVQKIDKIKTSLLGGIADGIVNSIVKSYMPGDPETVNVKKGQNNVDDFFVIQKTFNVKPGDVTSATAAKSGNNYVITLKLGNEVNPAKDGTSKYSRVFAIATRQDILDELKGTVEGDVNKTTLTYHGGFAEITVNPKGEIIGAKGNFFVDADAKDAKAKGLKLDLVANQSTTNTYTNFSW